MFIKPEVIISTEEYYIGLKDNCATEKYRCPYYTRENFKFYCSACDERFCFPSMFQDHVNMHTRHKPYKCKKCRKVKFSTFYNLSAHARLCDGIKIKSFTCRNCNKFFPDLGIYLQHIKEYEQELNSVVAYMKTVKECQTKSREFYCNFCGKSFCRLTLRDNHEKIHKKSETFVPNLQKIILFRISSSCTPNS